jgi:hypothetical protein
VSFLATGLLHVPADASDPRRVLYFIASAASLSVGAFTFAVIMPLNHHLKDMLRHAEKRSGRASEPEFSVDEADEALLGVNRWMVLNRVRMTFAGIGWVTATMTLLM